MSDNSARSNNWTGWLLAVLGVVLSLAYLSNPFAGLVEILPDAIPGIGNIDEVIATTILLTCLARLGIQITPNVAQRPLNPNVAPNLPPAKDIASK